MDGVVYSMARSQAAIFPPALRQASLFAKLVRIAEENLARNGKDFLIGEAIQQRLQKTSLHTHVAIEQHHHVVRSSAEPRVRSAPEAEVLGERE